MFTVENEIGGECCARLTKQKRQNIDVRDRVCLGRPVDDPFRRILHNSGHLAGAARNTAKAKELTGPKDAEDLEVVEAEILFLRSIIVYLA